MKLTKRLLRSTFGKGLAAKLGAFYIWLVYKTTRWTFLGYDIPLTYTKSGKSFITCFWHGNLLMLPYAWPTRSMPFYMLTSAHPDGKLVARIVRHFGILALHGSSTRGGADAFRQIINVLKQGAVVGLTPDGPKGPCHEVQEGIAQIARLAQVDILPVTYRQAESKTLRTWDRFQLPRPFGRGVLVWGDPISAPKSKEDIAETCLHIKNALQDLQQRAEDILTP